MWRLSIVILVLGALVQSAPTGDESGLLQRLRRSYCPPGPPGPLGPPGPPGQPPPPAPPHFHHHRHFGAYSEANARAESDQLQRFTQDQGQNHQDRGENYQEQGQNYQYQDQNYQGQRQNFQGQGHNAPCDTCKGQNSAISNAQSGTGNAVAIAVSKG